MQPTICPTCQQPQRRSEPEYATDGNFIGMWVIALGALVAGMAASHAIMAEVLAWLS